MVDFRRLTLLSFTEEKDTEIIEKEGDTDRETMTEMIKTEREICLMYASCPRNNGGFQTLNPSTIHRGKRCRDNKERGRYGYRYHDRDDKERERFQTLNPFTVHRDKVEIETDREREKHK